MNEQFFKLNIIHFYPFLEDVCVTPYGPSTRFGTGYMPFFVTMGDFNNDTKLDIASTNYEDSTVSILLGNRNGTFQDQKTVHVDAICLVYVTTGDFNNDNKLDLAVASADDYRNSVYILLGNGDGTAPSPIAVRDFNDDTKLDLVVTNSNNNSISILLDNGNGTFHDQKVDTVSSNPSFVTVGDFNNDSKLDLSITLFNVASVIILLGNGNGTFKVWRIIQLALIQFLCQ